MYEDFAPRLAQLLTNYSQPVHPGNYVLITASTEAEPLIRALYDAILHRGGHPAVQAVLPGLNEAFFTLAGDAQLDFVDPLAAFMMERVDVWYNISAPANTKALTTIDPARLARRQNSNRSVMETYFRRYAEGKLRWNISAWPTQSGAQEAEMGLLAYTGFVYNACAMQHPDPLAWWLTLKANQEKLVQYLAGKSRCEVRGPGIDMSFNFAGRLWVNCDGRVNFPDGEIFTGPVEDSVNGRVEFNFPTNYGGRQIDGVKLTFQEGKVVEASAEKGEDYLLSQLDLDPGARFLGEFAIGTNSGIQQFTGNTLFDEKIGGTIHMALGRSIPESKGVNASAIHWDMVHNMKDGGEIWIDGELFYQSGEFKVL